MITSLRGHASQANMTWQANNTGVPPNQKVNNAEELNYLPKSIA